MTEVMDQADNMHWTINNYCRLCANIDDNMVSIYDDQGADHMLENKIKMHLPFINISKNDLLPKQICYHCASTVLVWNELYECSSDADQKLRNLFEESLFDQSKNEPYDDIGIDVPDKDFIGGSIEYEEISEVNIFNKNTRSDKTLNELDKIPSTSKTDTILNDEHKPSVIEEEEEERLNPILKRYLEMTESDASLKTVATKEMSLSNNYYCSLCPEKFLKIRDKVKHDLEIHSVQSNVLPIKYVSDRFFDSMNIEKNKENKKNKPFLDVVEDVNKIGITPVNEKNDANFLCTSCNLPFKTSFEKLDHDQKMHDLQLATRQSKQIALSKNYDELFDDESEFDVEIQDPSCSKKSVNNCDASQATNIKIKMENSSNESSINVKDDTIESCIKSEVGKDLKCYYCNKQFLSKSVALKHVRSHMLKDKKLTPKSDNYDKYKVNIDNKLYYKCDQCNYAVEGRRYKFVYHMRVHTGEKPYKCEMCKKQFRTAAFLRRHIVCFHERVRGYQCDICGRSFSEKRNVDDHRRTHTGERPFVCETCGKSFAQRSSMKIHWKQMHESIKSHKCQYCEKSFIRRCHLVAHLTHHTGVRNYVCAVCGKAFLRSGTLKGHTAVHSTERPFKCTICGDSFKLKKHLKQHGRVHGNSHSFENRSQNSVQQLAIISEVHNN